MRKSRLYETRAHLHFWIMEASSFVVSNGLHVSQN